MVQKGGQLFCKAWEATSKPLTALASSRHCNRSLCPAGIFALAKLPCGVCVIVRAINLAHDKADQLRRIGIREGSRISLVSGHNPMLVVVENSRIALSHELARHIRVQTLFP